jgi:hypothetical protein
MIARQLTTASSTSRSKYLHGKWDFVLLLDAAYIEPRTKLGRPECARRSHREAMNGLGGGCDLS